MDSKWATVRNSSVHFLFSQTPTSSNIAIVLVHGLAVSSRYMIPLISELAHHFIVYAPDLPGYGKSDKPSHALTITELAEALKDWMKVVGITKAVLLGHSFGCQIIVELASNHKQIITQAILVGPTVDSRDRSPVTQLIRLLKDAIYEPPNLLLLLIRESIDPGMYRILKVSDYALKDQMQEKLPLIKIPVLLIRGAKDPIVPQQWLELMYKLLQQSKIIVLQKKGHLVNATAPKELTREVVKFIHETHYERNAHSRA